MSKLYLRYFYTFIHIKSKIWYVFHVYSTSHFRPVIFHVPTSHIWPVALVLDRIGIECWDISLSLSPTEVTRYTTKDKLFYFIFCLFANSLQA